MRIAQFIDTDSIGGAETLALELCCALRERGHEPLLLHFANRPLEERCLGRGIAVRQVPDHTLYKSARTLPRFIWRFSRFLRRLRLDAMHSHLLGAVAATAPAARLAGLRHVGTLHDTYSIPESPAYLHLLRFAAYSGALVAVSDHVGDFLRGYGGFGARLHTIHNGLSLPAKPAAHMRAEVRRLLAIDDEAVAIICVARLVPLKAHHRLIESFAALPAQPRSILLLAGDGPLMEALQRQAREMGIADRVRFLGMREDVPHLLAASDLFVLASETEGLSCSLLESMAAGLPAVATAVGGNPELVEDGITGLLVPPGDGNALRLALARLANEPALRRKLGAQAAMRMRARFSLRSMTDRYLALYRGEKAD